MRTLFSILFCLLLAAPSVNAGPPNPTASDAARNTAGGTDALINNVPNLSTGTSNTAFGFAALSSNTNGGYNTASGAHALFSNTTGFENTGFGYATLFFNITGRFNTASGAHALTFNTPGFENTASGGAALHSNTTGSFNTASGVAALFSNTTGTNNTASGAHALRFNSTGYYNTASGVHALRFNTIGYGNIADGYAALYANTTGSFNTGVGYQTFLRNKTGINNTAIGSTAGSLLTSGSHNLYLGSPGVASESSTLRLGSVQTRAFIKGVVGVPISGLHVTINAAGQLGVAPSSERYKQDILPIAVDESQKVHQLRPVSFHYKTEASGPLQYGLIAEEVAQVYPEVVTRDADGVIDGVRYEALTPILLKALQGRHQQIATQAQQLAELKVQNEQLQAALVQQNADMASRLARLEEAARTATLTSR